jgi:hypothetical protein
MRVASLQSSLRRRPLARIVPLGLRERQTHQDAQHITAKVSVCARACVWCVVCVWCVCGVWVGGVATIIQALNGSSNNRTQTWTYESSNTDF